MKNRKIVSSVALGLSISVAIFVLLLVVQDRIARPDIRQSDPVAMGKLESSMWKSYYDGHYARLAWQTMDLACRQYGFSLWDGARLSFHAARAAMIFRENQDDARIRPELEKYYSVVQKALNGKFDVVTAANLELLWWKQRRDHIAPQEYARTIARLTALVHGVPEESVIPAATMRAEAMAYRDARRDGKMTAADWEELNRQLSKAYASLKSSTTYAH